MALELRLPKSQWWYGRVNFDDRSICKNLGVKIQGTPPKSLRDLGDPLFERSRTRAQVALEKLQKDIKSRTTAEELVQTVHEIRTGERIRTLALKKMFDAWVRLPRKRKLSERYTVISKSNFDRFLEFIRKAYPKVKLASDIQPGMVRAFLENEEARGISPKTYNNKLIFLRSCFEALRKEAGLVENPFEGIPTKIEETEFRKPFNSEEISIIVEASQTDPFIEPIIKAGICTAMRRGDCCLLEWKSVDLDKGFIQVKTSKTGESVQIPIFPMLEEVLAQHSSRESKYVFPEQARMYEINPDGITYRVKKVLEQAGFSDAEKGSELSKEREQGLRRASVRDFHSFRVTWVTIALSSGVPIELVQRVTGHRTTQIVQKHYFQPGAEDFRKALSTNLPSSMVGSLNTTKMSHEAIKDKLTAMTPENWQNIRDEILSAI